MQATMQKIIILCILLIVFYVPVFSQNIHKDSIKVHVIEFGSGGGFSGKSKNFVLTKTGELYSVENILTDANALVYQKKIKACTARKIFNYAKKNKIIDIVYNEPGNLYHYITLSLKNKTNNLVWGSSNSTPSENIITLSTKLNNLL